MLKISKLSFPGLGIGEFSVNSVAFSLDLFGKTIDIAWYAIIITFGMICAITYAVLRSKKIGVTFDDILDMALYTIPVGVIGARLYYVMTKPEQFDTFEKIIRIRDGGLAIYGAIIAGGITVLICCLVKKINFFAIADCVAPGVLLAQGIGRWGNFMNGEAFGGETDLFCRMGLQNNISALTFSTTDMVYVHPTFLYESLWNIAGFTLAALLTSKKKYDGQIFLIIFGWYGLGRMFIEGLRTDSLYSSIFGIEFRTSQVLAAVIFVIATALIVYFMIKRPTRPLYFKTATKNTKEKKK